MSYNLDLQKNFSDLFKELKLVFKNFYKEYFNFSTRNELSNLLEKGHGVYLIFHNEKVIYIGSAGKFRNNIKPSQQGVRERILNAGVPYSIFENEIFHLVRTQKDKTTILMSPEFIPLKDIYIGVFYTKNTNIIPSSLEHLLIQSYCNENQGQLPMINNEL